MWFDDVCVCGGVPCLAVACRVVIGVGWNWRQLVTVIGVICRFRRDAMHVCPKTFNSSAVAWMLRGSRGEVFSLGQQKPINTTRAPTEQYLRSYSTRLNRFARYKEICSR